MCLPMVEHAVGGYAFIRDGLGNYWASLNSGLFVWLFESSAVGVLFSDAYLTVV